MTCIQRARASPLLRAFLNSQTLDLFVQLCKQRGYPHVRLDGSIGQNKRQKLVTAFNNAQASRPNGRLYE